MIRLDRRELREIAQIALFANTPYSLCRALEESSAVRRMIRSCQAASARIPHVALFAAFARMTARTPASGR